MPQQAGSLGAASASGPQEGPSRRWGTGISSASVLASRQILLKGRLRRHGASGRQHPLLQLLLMPWCPPRRGLWSRGASGRQPLWLLRLLPGAQRQLSRRPRHRDTTGRQPRQLLQLLQVPLSQLSRRLRRRGARSRWLLLLQRELRWQLSPRPWETRRCRPSGTGGSRHGMLVLLLPQLLARLRRWCPRSAGCGRLPLL